MFLSVIKTRVEAQDGGDPKVDASPRDIVYTELAEPVANSVPQIIAQTDLRYGYFICLFFFPFITYICFSAVLLDILIVRIKIIHGANVDRLTLVLQDVFYHYLTLTYVMHLIVISKL